ncbi:MAG: YggS family pyridoxal phosphate-dependent enzyme [Erysipelotrichaceae bacterium]|nr:YggS family pyridoxal phosphate-dependent enzyme [Erysipelotrichaceae bacterium]
MKNNIKSLPLTIVAVSKNRSKSDIKRLFDQGFTIFGENRVQELLTKVDIDLPIIWHMIGHLQTNKVKFAVKYCAMIQSVDSLKLLKAIDQEAQKQDKVMPVLIQVNIAKEETKFGITKDELIPMINKAKELDNIIINGLMVIGPNTDDKDKILTVFQEGNLIYQELKKIAQSNLNPIFLSMGMSNDYQIAIDAGSNMIRIGRLLFSEY